MPLIDHIRPEPNPPLTRERVENARRMYAEGFTVSRICSHCLISFGTLYKILDGSPFGAEGEQWPKLPRRNPGAKPRRLLSAHGGSPAPNANAALHGHAPQDVSLQDTSLQISSLHDRVMRIAERLIRDVEWRLRYDNNPGIERERDGRVLVSVMRALRDLRLSEPSAPARARRIETADEGPPDDIDARRAELMRRLNAMAESERERRARDAE